MKTLAFRSYSEARRDFKDVLDNAETGRPVGVQRRAKRVAIVDAEGFRSALEHSRDLPEPVAVSEAGGWTIFLPGVPVAVDAETFDDATEEFVEALREYAEDWGDRLHAVPNHALNWALIQFVALSSNAQLSGWIRGTNE